ncbi:30S ribosomal protein S13 [Candidatus Pacearchaeota archaeon]|nr:30S ribosomal protein S13 [Candidatus Pacearchaeota archaeon]
MAEKQETKEKNEKQAKKPGRLEKVEKKRPEQSKEENEVLVRIFGYDIPGSRNIYTGLTRIKGISWTISNAVCLKLGFPKSKKVSELSKPDIQKIESFLKNLPVYDFLKNRRTDIETGKTAHFFGTDLEMKRDFDIKRLREIKSYRGIRHALKQPVRGQRTRSHFRKSGVAMGVKKKVE